MAATWLKDAVFYEIYPQSFCDSNGDGICDECDEKIEDNGEDDPSDVPSDEKSDEIELPEVKF